MTDALYLTATEAVTGSVGIIRSIVGQLEKVYPSVGVFRAYLNGEPESDPIVTEFDAGYGTTREHYIEDEPSAMNRVIRQYRKFATQHDAVLIVGLIDDDPVNPGLISRAGRTAANLGAPMALVVDGTGKSADRTSGIIQLAAFEVAEEHVPVAVTFVLNAPEGLEEEIAEEAPNLLVLTDPEDVRVPAVFAEKVLTTTPLMFENELMERARAKDATIVLPEAEDDRVLAAAAQILAGGVTKIIFLGNQEEIDARATELGLDLSAASVVSLDDESYLDRYVPELARLRAKKGMTEDEARTKLASKSYFATMMVHMGDADGMVSGATHTTAETILPSFQIIKTKPGTSIVSSVFLMLLSDRVLVYGDCAVNPNPTPEQLADIAVSSAETAAQFGVEPRVAMLSYSTGDSGSGADVDAVIEATRLARERRPDLAIEGPIQYDAAVDPTVAKKKLPESDVAGRATVFVFPSLNAGNIGYKAVQRSSGAVAVGPVLQGLNKPVNDLSRGALVSDIVNTVAITAVQAEK